MENPKDSAPIPFSDTLFCLGSSNILTSSVYKRLTHMNQNPYWGSHHNQLTKYSILDTISHRTMVYSNQQMPKEEEDHINETLLMCDFATGALNRLQTKIYHEQSQGPDQCSRQWTNNSNNNNTHKIYTVVPYSKRGTWHYQEYQESFIHKGQ